MNLGASVFIKGEIAATENLHISGRVEGSICLEDGAVLTLGDGSSVVGEIVASSVEVLGRVDGNITATERIAIRGTAVIDGTLTTPALSIAEGAQINGRIEMPARQRQPVVEFPVAV
jgi:cytoskeletal protein CcmA (bactofilin family)